MQNPLRGQEKGAGEEEETVDPLIPSLPFPGGRREGTPQFGSGKRWWKSLEPSQEGSVGARSSEAGERKKQ